MNSELLLPLIERYKSDPEGVYATWFIAGEERMKAFRAIRRGVKATTDAITANTFGNDFKGSPLEVVEGEVMAQLNRPAFRDDLRQFPFVYLPFDSLEKHAEAMATFGESRDILGKIARRPQDNCA